MFVDEPKFVTNGSAVEEGMGSVKCGVCVCVCVCVVCGVCVAYKLTYCKIQMYLGHVPQNHL